MIERKGTLESLKRIGKSHSSLLDVVYSIKSPCSLCVCYVHDRQKEILEEIFNDFLPYGIEIGFIKTGVKNDRIHMDIRK